MVQQVLINDDDYYVPDANQLVTEDDTPVDNFASAKQQRLLVRCYQDGNILLTGDEHAEQESQRAQLLAERLRAMGIDPDTL